MSNAPHRFDDSAGYERLMGRWSRAVGAVFIDWMAPPATARWLDTGCGTGVFTELVLNTCSPASVCAVDPAQSQIEHASRQPMAQRAAFRVADAAERLALCIQALAAGRTPAALVATAKIGRAHV